MSTVAHYLRWWVVRWRSGWWAWWCRGAGGLVTLAARAPRPACRWVGLPAAVVSRLLAGARRTLTVVSLGWLVPAVVSRLVAGVPRTSTGVGVGWSVPQVGLQARRWGSSHLDRRTS